VRTTNQIDPLEAALEEGIFRLLQGAQTSRSGYDTTLAQCVRAFNGAFTDEEIKRVVRRLIASGRLGVRTRFGRMNSQPYLEIELWEIREDGSAAAPPEPAAVGSDRESK